MKYIVTLIIGILFSTSVNAQSLFSLNYTASFSLGETQKYINNPSFRGFSVDGRRFLGDRFTVGASFTWSTFYEKLSGASYTEENLTVTGTQFRYLNVYPILFQAHYYIGYDINKPRLYMGGGIGPYVINQTTNIGTWSFENKNCHLSVPN